jgi:hypothetical protein
VPLIEPSSNAMLISAKTRYFLILLNTSVPARFTFCGWLPDSLKNASEGQDSQTSQYNYR